jgi:G-protein signaling modulator 2
MGQHADAYHFAVRHLQISRETGDRMGQATAQLNIAELCKTLGYPDGGQTEPANSAQTHEEQLQQQQRVEVCVESCDSPAAVQDKEAIL